MTSSLAALALATPIFGFALAPPTYAAPALGPELATEVAAVTPVAPAGDEDPFLARQLDTRETMADWMTALGLASLGGMIATNVIGAIEFHDRYGFAGSLQETHCARGEAVLSEACEGTAWAYSTVSGITTALYITTASLGVFMPDPLHVGEQPGPHGDRVRLHRGMRWVTTSLVILHSLLGGILALADDWFGLDPADDFDAYQGLATARLAAGMAATASLAVQGAIMLF